MIEKIIEEQQKLGLTDTEFAKYLGISISYWSLLKRGKRSLRNLDLLTLIGHKLPGLVPHILEYVGYFLESKDGNTGYK